MSTATEGIDLGDEHERGILFLTSTETPVKPNALGSGRSFGTLEVIGKFCMKFTAAVFSHAYAQETVATQ